MHQGIKSRPAKVERESMKKTSDTGEVQEEHVIEMVFKKIGKIPNFLKISARNVFDNNWRVNIWTHYQNGVNVCAIYEISYSFFCTIEGGEIVESNPEITRIGA
jgi:hypothetical protein